jgi:hypothetical protein
MKKEQIIKNAKNLGHQTQTAAFAASLVGIDARSICCWCAEHVSGDFQRLPRGGECSRCAYTGRDTGVLFS